MTPVGLGMGPGDEEGMPAGQGMPTDPEEILQAIQVTEIKLILMAIREVLLQSDVVGMNSHEREHFGIHNAKSILCIWMHHIVF